MSPKPYVLIAASALALGACGTAPEERSVSGAGIGAGAGAILGAVTGLTVVEGAALGAAGGALTGVLTDKEDVNLGEPIWKKSSEQSSRQTAANPAGPSETVTSIQGGLAALGYDPGPVDGMMGERTRSAIRQYQQDHNLLVDGQPSSELALHIQQQNSGGQR